MHEYTYIGSANWGERERTCFLTPIFRNNEKYYVQEIENHRIVRFVTIPAPEEEYYTPAIRKINVQVEQDALHCFSVRGELIEGTRKEIVLIIAKLLEEDNMLNVHSKLIMANFLNLFHKQMELINEVNKEFERMEVDSQIAFEDLFEVEENVIDISPSNIGREIKLLHEERVNWGAPHDAFDIGIAHKDAAYFGSTKYSLAAVYNKELTEDKEVDIIIGTVLKKSMEITGEENRNRIMSNLMVCEYMMSSSVFLEDDMRLSKGLSSFDLKVSGSIIMEKASRIDKSFKTSVEASSFGSEDLKSRLKSIDNSLETIITQAKLE